MPGWMVGMVSRIGGSSLAILNFAVAAVAAIAVAGAASSYLQSYLTTNVGQRVMHDLRRTLYHHIHRLSLAEHDETRTGDLISRVTSDIESIQDFVASALLGIVATSDARRHRRDHALRELALHADLAVDRTGAVPGRVSLHAAHQEGVACRQEKESELISIVQEVLSSIRVVKAFAREDYEQQRFERQSLDNVERSCRRAA